jgi:protein-S-isoprenylcysteine O-methyltransferase Ste14
MPRLALKVPPDVVELVLAALMWLVATRTPSLHAPLAYRLFVALVLFVPAVAVVVAARVALARAATTFSPIAPERSSRLVTTGVYRLTRNPMYLGMLLALLALAALLANLFSLLLPVVFVAYMNLFQIAPEERVLGARFGSAYEAYARGVRRWV